MSRVRLPGMQALQSFHAVARTGSISKAAQLLHVTHGAVCHQIKALEDFLDVRLVSKTGRHICLTDEGRKFACHIGATLDQLSLAIRETRSGPSRELRVSVTSSFASKWLLPRVGSFVAKYPDVDLHINATPTGDCWIDEIDVAIHYGGANSPGLVSELIWQDDFSPVCSPSLRPRLPTEPADLSGHKLLRADREPWTPWFRAAGLDWHEPSRGPVFNDSAHLLQAALTGQGVALARRSLSADDLARGALVEPFDVSVPAERPLHLIYPASLGDSRQLVAFRRWLLDEVAPFAQARTGTRVAAKRLANGNAADNARWNFRANLSWRGS